MIAILSAIWLVGGFITSFIFHWFIPDSIKFVKWIIAAAALWPFTLPAFIAYSAFVTAPQAMVKKFKKEKVGQ